MQAMRRASLSCTLQAAALRDAQLQPHMLEEPDEPEALPPTPPSPVFSVPEAATPRVTTATTLEQTSPFVRASASCASVLGAAYTSVPQTTVDGRGGPAVASGSAGPVSPGNLATEIGVCTIDTVRTADEELSMTFLGVLSQHEAVPAPPPRDDTALHAPPEKSFEYPDWWEAAPVQCSGPPLVVVRFAESSHVSAPPQNTAGEMPSNCVVAPSYGRLSRLSVRAIHLMCI